MKGPAASSLARRAAKLLVVGFSGHELSQELKDLIDCGVSGVILFSRNIVSPEQVAELSAAIKHYAGRPFSVAVDQEGGVVQRLKTGFTRLPPMRTLGHAGDPGLARRVGRLLGQELSAVGIDVNFAPVLDVDTNPQNPVIGARSFSSDPEIVAQLGIELGRGLQELGVASCGKHFPGHGDTELDSHLALPRLRHPIERLMQVELLPFQRWADARLASVMTAHVVFEALDPHYPATMSVSVIGGLLRNQLQYDGLVISDDLEMKAVFEHFGAREAAICGLLAGVDQFLVCHRADVALDVIAGLCDAVAEGRIAEQQLSAAEQRNDQFLQRWARSPRLFDPKALPSAEGPELVAQLALGLGPSELSVGIDPTERNPARG